MMLMACTNVGSLLLVRVAARTREISVRYALGAKRARVIQQLLAEGMLFGLGRGIAGIALGTASIPAADAHAMARSAVRLAFSSQPDLRILAFNFALALLASLFFSLVPALQFWRPT